jgi:putative membrane protein
MPVIRAARRLAWAGVALPLAARAAWAHPGRPAEPHDLWSAWSVEPVTIALLALSAWLWIRGTRAMARHAGARGLGAHGAGARRWRGIAFATGWLTLAVALLSPLHALGGALFWAHMAQHELLAVVAAPLLVVARPLAPMLWALPPDWRRALGAWMHRPAPRRAWHALAQPVAAFAIHAVALWAWHLPAAYEASLASEPVHAAQHASFFLTALLYWWSVLAARAAMGGAVLSLFGTALHTGALGALITFSGALWYPSYAATTGAWGLMPLEDQELAGLVMWIPGGMAYVIAALALVSRLMRASEWRAAPLDAVVHRR